MNVHHACLVLVSLAEAFRIEYLSGDKSLNPCDPTILILDVRFNDNVFQHTILLNGSVPLLNITETVKNGSVVGIKISVARKELHINASAMSDEVGFLRSQKDFIMNLSRALGPNNTQSVRVEYFCQMYTPFNCSVYLFVGGEEVLRNEHNEITVFDEKNEATITAFAHGYNLGVLSERHDEIASRWSDVCTALVALDNSSYTRASFNLTYTVKPRQIICEMVTEVPMMYVVTVAGSGIPKKIGYPVSGSMPMSLKVTAYPTQSANISGVLCQIESPTGWITRLTSPDGISIGRTTTTTATKINISPRTVTKATTLYINTTEAEDFKDGPDRLSNNHSTAAAVLVPLALLVTAGIVTIIFRKKLRLTRLDNAMARFQRRFQYVLARTSP